MIWTFGLCNWECKATVFWHPWWRFGVPKAKLLFNRRIWLAHHFIVLASKFHENTANVLHLAPSVPIYQFCTFYMIFDMKCYFTGRNGTISKDALWRLFCGKLFGNVLKWYMEPTSSIRIVGGELARTFRL